MSKDKETIKIKAKRPSKKVKEEIIIFNSDGTINQPKEENK